MQNVKIFSTDIKNSTQVHDISSAIYLLFPQSRVTVDLEDCDKVLRVEGDIPNNEYIINILSKFGIRCEVLK